MLRTHRLLATVALAAGLSAAPTFAADADSAAHRLFEDYFERQLQLNPLLATFIGDHRYDDKLTNNISPEHIAIALDVDRKALENAQKLAAGRLSDTDRLSVEILSHLRASLRARSSGRAGEITQSRPADTIPVLCSGASAQPFGLQGYDVPQRSATTSCGSTKRSEPAQGLAQTDFPRVLMRRCCRIE